MKLIYKGKAKNVYELDENTVLLEFRDDITAFDGKKRETIHGKGSINAKISSILFEVLNKNNIPTHYIRFEEPNKIVAKKLEMIPLEVICRNIATGSLIKRYPFKDGDVLKKPIVEFCLKDDRYHDPLLNEDIAYNLGISDEYEMKKMKEITLAVNNVLKKFLEDKGIILVDFKLEFGRDKGGNIYVADEITPDTCRFWDKETKEIMDKDRFRKDLGNVLEFYKEVLKRISA